MTGIDTGTEQLLCEVRNGVALITLNRPEARNALSDTLTPALRTTIKERSEDPNVGTLLITGAGTAFCAGGDVKGMAQSNPKVEMTVKEKIAQLKERQRTLTGVLHHCPKPTIAALPGPAAGAGLAIALACDIRIAAESAFIRTGYARVGLSGDYGIAWLLTNLVGTARARELMYTAERVGSKRCEGMGLINRVVPDTDLQAEAWSMATRLAKGPSLAFREMKANLNDALEMNFLAALDGEATRLVPLARTDDHKEAVAAFKEKREPNFSGR